jgi:hypothetical protein
MPITNEVPLTSRLLTSASYNDDLWTLSLKFHDGSRWTYQDVPPEVYDEFITAKSQGKWYTANIKGKFGSLKEEDATPKAPKGQVIPPTAKEIGFSTDELPAPLPLTMFADRSFELESGVELAESKAASSNETINPSTLLFSEPVHAETEPAPDIAAEMHAEEAKAVTRYQQDSPKIETTIDSGRRTAASALMCVVKDDASHAKAVALRNQLQDAKRSAFDFLDPIRDAVYKAYQVVQQKQKDALSPIEGAIIYLGKEILSYERKKEQELKEEAARRQKVADDAAAAEQKRRSEELTLSAASEAAERGDDAKAEEILNNPIQAAPVAAYVPQVASSIPMSPKRQNWKAEITSIEDLILDIAAGIESSRKGAGIGAHAPYSFLLGVETDKDGKLSSSSLNLAAKSLKDMMRYPGTRAYDDPVLLGSRKR